MACAAAEDRSLCSLWPGKRGHSGRLASLRVGPPCLRSQSQSRAVLRNGLRFGVVGRPLGQARRMAGVKMAVHDSKRRVALLTRGTRPDGAYLSEDLLGLGYTVHGIKRRACPLP